MRFLKAGSSALRRLFLVKRLDPTRQQRGLPSIPSYSLCFALTRMIVRFLPQMDYSPFQAVIELANRCFATPCCHEISLVLSQLIRRPIRRNRSIWRTPCGVLPVRSEPSHLSEKAEIRVELPTFSEISGNRR